MIIIFLLTTLHTCEKDIVVRLHSKSICLAFIVLFMGLQITYHFQNNDHSHLCPKNQCYIMDNRAGGTRGSIATQILLELDAKTVLKKTKVVEVLGTI